MRDIPSDILREVLLRLPADSLFRFRNVCKAWCRIIDDPFFVRSHSINQHSNCSSLLIRDLKGGCLYSFSLETLNHAKDGDQTIEVEQLMISRGVPHIYSVPISVCHGLILISNFSEDDNVRNWVIWNPLTRDFLKLPIPLNSEFVESQSAYLCYDHSTDDYRVVRIDVIERGVKVVFRTLVYSLKSGFWRVSKDCPRDIYGGKGVFLNGALYWRSEEENEIIMFDVGTEDYTRLQGPPLSARYSNKQLEVMGGYLVFSCYVDNMRMLEGWIMGDINGVWKKLFSFRRGIKYLRPVAYLKEQRLVILQEFYKGLFLLDVDSNTLRKVTINDMPCVSCMQFFPGSLFRLKDHGGGDAAAGVKRKRKRAHR